MKTNARAVFLSAMIFLFSGYSLWATVYMTPEELQALRIQEMVYEGQVVPRPAHVPVITDFGEDYNRAALFLTTLQVTEPGPDFGGMREAEHLPDIIQTDNTEEAVWIWSRYYELTGDESIIPYIDNAWVYIWNFPSWREEGGNHPSYGYYRYYVGGWGLLAEMKYRQVFGDSSHWAYADSAANYYIQNYLNHEYNVLNLMVKAWAMGCLYLYGEDTGNPTFTSHAAFEAGRMKLWTEADPDHRLNREDWAMSGGAVVWGLASSYFRDRPGETPQWMTTYAPYMKTFDPSGSWVLAHNAWYALGHWSAFRSTADLTYRDNHHFLTDTLLAQDGDLDGGIPAHFDDSDDMDQSWCTAYLGFMCLNPLVEAPVAVVIAPQDAPVVIPPEGGQVTYDGALSSSQEMRVRVDVWSMVALPGGGRYGPVRIYRDIRLDPFEGLSGVKRERVPAVVPAGEYLYKAYVGRYPHVKVDSSSFGFTKEGELLASDWTEPVPEFLPRGLELCGNYPNPFNLRTTIYYHLPAKGHVALEVYNISGQRVETLVDREEEGGFHQVTWNAEESTSGVYFYRLTTGAEQSCGEMILLK
jgi:hypothetical protein